MFRSLMTIIRELYLYLTKVIFMLQHSVKLCRLGDVAACRRAAYVLCAVQSETVGRHVCCVQCRVRL